MLLARTDRSGPINWELKYQELLKEYQDLKKAKPVTREDGQLISDLYTQVRTLQRDKEELIKAKIKLNEQLEKRKKELALVKKHSSNKYSSSYVNKENPPISATGVDIFPAPNTLSHKAMGSTAVVDSHGLDGGKLLALATQYKARMENAEAALKKAHEEIATLRDGSKVSHGYTETDKLMRDTQWQVQQMKTQKEHLKRNEEQLEEYAQRVRELKRTLEELRQEKETTDTKASRAIDLEEQIRELKTENRSLEDKIARLCEAPFISDAFGMHEARIRYDELVNERQDLKMKVDHLNGAVTASRAVLLSMQNSQSQLLEEKKTLEEDLAELQRKYNSQISSANSLQEKLRLYSGEDGVNIEDLERALTVVRRRGEAATRLDFLEDPDGGLGEVTVPILKRKLQDVQVMNLNLTKDVEKLESMLNLQQSINKDLHKELELSAVKRDKDKRELLQRAEDFEQLAIQRLEKIEVLQAQVREQVSNLKPL